MFKKIFILAKLDHYVEGLIHVLSESKSNTVIACSDLDDECLEKYSEHQPDVLFIHNLSLDHPIARFLEKFKVECRNVKILIFGHHMENSSLINVVQSGAHGYITEGMSADQLFKAISCVCAGELWVERHILTELVRNSVELDLKIKEMITKKIEVFGRRLARREIDVFQLILKGLTTKEMSDELSLSQQSVKVYLGRIFKKLKVTNRAQLLLVAFEDICPVSNILLLFRSSLDGKNMDKLNVSDMARSTNEDGGDG